MLIVWAAVSNTTVARPVAVVLTGGTSFAPLRLVTKVIGIAWAVGIGSMRAAVRINASEICFISALPTLV